MVICYGNPRNLIYQMAKVNITVTKHNDIMYSCYDTMKSKFHPWNSCHNSWPQFIDEKKTDKLNLRDILQINPSEIVKDVKDIKDEERLMYCHKLEETKETWWINAMWYLGLHTKTEIDISGKTWNVNKICKLVNSIITMLISLFNTYTTDI